jgi:hypothetical protein
MATSRRLSGPGKEFPLPAGSTDFSLFHSVQIGSGAHTGFCSMGIEGSSS